MPGLAPCLAKIAGRLAAWGGLGDQLHHFQLATILRPMARACSFRIFSVLVQSLCVGGSMACVERDTKLRTICEVVSCACSACTELDPTSWTLVCLPAPSPLSLLCLSLTLFFSVSFSLSLFPFSPFSPHSLYRMAENQFERFRWFLELISRFEFEFRRCENYIF